MSTSPRLRRLAADYEALRAEYAGHPHVVVEPRGAGRPPENYRVTFRLPGLRLDGDQPQLVDEHIVDIDLPRSYPRQAPYCQAVTAVFHPNIAGHYCVSDQWYAGQSLTDFIARLGDLIQYRSYNVKSPMDAQAARWAANNAALFPLGNVVLTTPEVEIGPWASAGSPASRIRDAVRDPRLARLAETDSATPSEQRTEHKTDGWSHGRSS